jgi:hypothetical protein
MFTRYRHELLNLQQEKAVAEAQPSFNRASGEHIYVDSI